MTVRERLLSDIDPEIRWSALRRSVEYPDDRMSELLGELAVSRGARLRFRTEGSDEPRWAPQLTRSEYDGQMREAVAAHPSTPKAGLIALMNDKSPEVLSALVANPSLEAKSVAALVRKMQASRSVSSREWFAASQSVPMLEALASDGSVQVRVVLARNPAASFAVLSRLSEDDDRTVRLAVLENQVPRVNSPNPSRSRCLQRALTRSCARLSGRPRAELTLSCPRHWLKTRLIDCRRAECAIQTCAGLRRRTSEPARRR